MGPGSPFLPELREAGLKTADPLGFVLGTKASSRPGLSGEWLGAHSLLRGRAGLAGSVPACSPTAPEPSASYSESPLSFNKSIKGRQIWGD